MFSRYNINLLCYGILRNNGINPTDVATIIEKYVGNGEFCIKNNHILDTVVLENSADKILSFKIIDNTLDNQQFSCLSNSLQNDIYIEIGVIGLKKSQLLKSNSNSSLFSLNTQWDNDELEQKKEILLNNLIENEQLGIINAPHNKTIEIGCGLEKILEKIKLESSKDTNVNGNDKVLKAQDIVLHFIRLAKTKSFVTDKDDWNTEITTGHCQRSNYLWKSDAQQETVQMNSVQSLYKYVSSNNHDHNNYNNINNKSNKKIREYCIRPNDLLIMCMDKNKHLLSFYKGNMNTLIGRHKSYSDDAVAPFGFVNGYWKMNPQFEYFPCFATRGCNCHPHGTLCEISVVMDDD